MNSSFDPKKYLSRELLFICRVLSFVEPKANELMLDLKALSPEILLVTLKQHHIYPVFYTRWVLFKDHKELQTPEWNQFTDDLKTLVYSNRLQVLHKLKVLVEVTSALEKEGIPVIALKGPVLSKVIYGDFAMKSSLDLDILIDKTQTDEAMEVLKRMGFGLAKYNLELNPSQKKYLKNHFHHLGFYHPEKKVQLELHWQLNTNRYLLQFSFEDLLKNSLAVRVGEHGIRIFKDEFRIPYLMIHGGYHAWYRLDWLYDFSVSLNKVHPRFEEIKLTCKKLDLSELFNLSVDLSSIFFKTNFGIIQRNQRVKFCLSAMKEVGIPEFTNPLGRFRHKLFLLHFKKDLKYKLQVFLSIRTNMLDWATVKLPDKLFFIYYFIRPFVIITNQFRFKNRRIVK